MIFDGFLGMLSKDLGIDLGTANTLVVRARRRHHHLRTLCRRGHSRTPIKVVMCNGEIAVGDVAKRMIGKTHSKIQAIRPLKNGVIADFEITEALLTYFIRKAHGRSRFIHPRVIVAVPSGITTRRKARGHQFRRTSRRPRRPPDQRANGRGAGSRICQSPKRRAR